jgi:hypothetical protein
MRRRAVGRDRPLWISFTRSNGGPSRLLLPISIGNVRIRRQTVEHVFGTLKSWMGSTHFLMKRLPNVRTEMSLHVLAYNLRRAMQILGVVPLMKAIRA